MKERGKITITFYLNLNGIEVIEKGRKEEDVRGERLEKVKTTTTTEEKVEREFILEREWVAEVEKR